jgi:hypothetical protein
LVKRKRQHANAADRPAWEMEDLLFVCAHRQDEQDAITFVHFAQPKVEGRAARLTSFGWTQDSHNRTVLEFNLPPLRWPEDTTQVADWRNQWLGAFDVEKVTKQFFREIANWYFWALKHIRFPKDAPKEADGHDHVSVIRLITRLIFCWFVKEKGLIPGALFDEGHLAQTLDGFAPDKTSAKDSVFYKAILQNLFFATLNTEMDKRGWPARNRISWPTASIGTRSVSASRARPWNSSRTSPSSTAACSSASTRTSARRPARATSASTGSPAAAIASRRCRISFSSAGSGKWT